jgi:hypothetical protein
MEVGDHLYVSPPPRRKELPVTAEYKLGLSLNPSGRFRGEKNLFPLMVLELRFLGCPTRSLVTVLACFHLLWHDSNTTKLGLMIAEEYIERDVTVKY